MSVLNFPRTEANSTGEHLAHRLQQQLGSRFRGVHIDVMDDGLILRGRVGTYYAKQIAQHVLMRLTELPILANDIEVR
jgi:hypothetical protein